THHAGQEEVSQRCPHATMDQVRAQGFEITCEPGLGAWPPGERMAWDGVEASDALGFKPGDPKQCIEHTEQDDQAKAQQEQKTNTGAYRTEDQPDNDPAERTHHGDRKSTRLNSSHVSISYA